MPPPREGARASACEGLHPCPVRPPAGLVPWSPASRGWHTVGAHAQALWAPVGTTAGPLPTSPWARGPGGPAWPLGSTELDCSPSARRQRWVWRWPRAGSTEKEPGFPVTGVPAPACSCQRRAGARDAVTAAKGMWILVWAEPCQAGDGAFTQGMERHHPRGHCLPASWT